MQNQTVQHQGRSFQCVHYSVDDEPSILNIFFFWKTTVLLAEQSNTRKPQLPETFSEPFCCLNCDLLHKKGAGPDAFRVDAAGTVTEAIEIKATVTEAGFTDVKRTMDFDELIWLSFSGYASLGYSIYRITKSDISSYVQKSKTDRDRGTINLRKIVNDLHITPLITGRIGIIKALAVPSQETALSVTEQTAALITP